jgi:hypothetical protein
MAAIDLFRTYPAPGSSWRRWVIYIDGAEHGHIGGAGHRRIAVDDGEHQIRVTHGGSESVSLAINARSGVSIPVLVGLGIRDAEGFGVKRIGIKVCAETSDLPRCGVPLHTPGGNKQTFVQGRTEAVVGLVFAGAIALFFSVAGVLALVKGFSSSQHASVVGGLAGVFVGVFVAIKFRPGVRLVANQWSWPPEDWRVDIKGDELTEWKRWAAPDVPDEAH